MSEDKWCKGSAITNKGVPVSFGARAELGWTHCCLLGGCEILNGADHDYVKTVETAIKVLGFWPRILWSRNLCPIAAFNDHRDTTWDDVKAVITKVEELLYEPVSMLSVHGSEQPELQPQG